MLLEGMASGRPQPPEAIRAFVAGVLDGSVSRPQAAAWLAWAYARTLGPEETLALTDAMLRSGTVLAWPDGPEVVDKHSTGGVGDKVSLVLAPLWAELGLRVPMISGRGLGHTGGTLDKLDAIPGFATRLPLDRLRAVLAETGCFLAGQTDDLAPADRVLYALRDEVRAVASVPLIVASILSKKLAEGLDRLVLDVKVGSGGFMPTHEAARALARSLVAVSEGAGVRTRAYVTEMGRPLGRAVGNAVEVAEAVACLQGGGPADLRELVLALAEHPGAAAALDDGRAFARFERVVAAQGGDVAALHDPRRLAGAGCAEAVVRSTRSGVVHAVDARAVAEAAFALGAGRRHADDAVDPGVGVLLEVAVGHPVAAGDALARVLHRDGHGFDEASARLRAGIVVADGPIAVSPLVHEVIDGARIG